MHFFKRPRNAVARRLRVKFIRSSSGFAQQSHGLRAFHMQEDSTSRANLEMARRDAFCAQAMGSRAMNRDASECQRDSLRVIRTRVSASSWFPDVKKIAEVTIFLDTEFHQNYTFVSCMLMSCSIVVLSIGRIDKWQPRKQPRKSSRRQPRRQPRRSNPTQGKRRTGDAISVPRSALVRCLCCEGRTGVAYCAVLGMER
jgi:hypothetical protein